MSPTFTTFCSNLNVTAMFNKHEEFVFFKYLNKLLTSNDSNYYRWSTHLWNITEGFLFIRRTENWEIKRKHNRLSYYIFRLFNAQNLDRVFGFYVDFHRNLFSDFGLIQSSLAIWYRKVFIKRFFDNFDRLWDRTIDENCKTVNLGTFWRFEKFSKEIYTSGYDSELSCIRD